MIGSSSPGELLYCSGSAWGLAFAITSGGLVGLGTAAPNSGAVLDLGSANTNSMLLPSGTSAQRPTGANGMIRYNSTVPQVEAYYSGAWNALGGGGSSAITLGTSASATNPQRSGQAGTGLFSATSNVVSIADNSADVMDIGTQGPNILGTITSGSYSIGYQINGVNALWQDNTNFNMAMGATALPTTLSQSGGGQNGQYDFAIGYHALNANTTGNQNTAIGTYALTVNTTGQFNTAIGANTLAANTTGNGNTAVGNATLFFNTTGIDNTAIGYYALLSTTTGGYNTAVGDWALYYNNTGQYNTAIGHTALQDNTTGQYNTAVGAQALYANTTGTNNVAIGYNVASTTQKTGSGNILIGTSSAVDVPSDPTSNFLNIGNVIFATGMTGTVSSPAGNVGIGTTNPALELTLAGGSIGLDNSQSIQEKDTGGTYRRMFFYDASNNYGARNEGVAGSSYYGNSNSSNTYGNIFFQTLGNVVMFINTAGNVGIGTTSPGYPLTVNGQAVATSFTPSSDERLKKNIQTLDDALERLGKLRGVSFDWRLPDEREIGRGMVLPTDEHQMGVIAQEVEPVFPEAVNTGNDGVKNVNYNALVAPLIEAVKEQQREIRQQEQKIEDQQEEIDNLTHQVSALKTGANAEAHGSTDDSVR